MEPRLYLPLRQALAALFSLSTINPISQPNLSHSQAHDFLIHVQSRNIRRKILSIQQKHCDQLKRNKRQDDKRPSSELLSMGSSWLACLLLLVRRNDHGITPTERLFAAQTLLQRLRRNKLEDAVDLELEQADIDEIQALGLYNEPNSTIPVLMAYLQLLHSWDPFIGRVLVSANLSNPDPKITEGQWKGHVTLLTLTSILYLTVSSSIDKEEIHSMPLLRTLATAVATVTLRLLGESDNEQFSFVPTLVDIFDMIRRADESTAASNSSLGVSLTYDVSLQATLAAIPESLLGSPDGQSRRGRLSLHPDALQEAYGDLRDNGFNQLRDRVLSKLHGGSLPMSMLWSLKTLECWSRFLPLPVEVWDFSLPIVTSFLNRDKPEYVKAALACLLAIWEGAACTEEEMLALSLGLTAEQQHGKKKQSSKSKKRHKELLNQRSDDALAVQVRNDVIQRGRIACLAATQTWEALIPHFQKAMEAANSHHQIDGEGPIGCLAAAAQACLPHILRHPTRESNREAQLFGALSEALQRICASSNPLVRVLALEPTYKLHGVVLSILRSGNTLDDALEALLVDHFYNCCMSLATSCAYPKGYFDNLSALSDENLEIYRNDVRDVLRSVAGSDEGGSTANVEASRAPLSLSQKVLQKVLHSILESIFQSRNAQLPDEAAIHALSALAKPLNHQALGWDHLGAQNLETALRCLSGAQDSVLSSLAHSSEAHVVFPVARTLNIAVASLSPMIAKVGVAFLESSGDKKHQIGHLLRSAIRLILTSIENFPELPAIPNHDIHLEARGAMRGPGGEDHVACVALMRLCSSSDQLGRIVAEESRPFLPKMCELYQRLKTLEVERGGRLLNVQGTTPKSRRILLGVICRIETITQGGASTILDQIFTSAVQSIASQHAKSLDPAVLLTLCEATYDLSAFPSSIVASLFDYAGNGRELCREVLIDACCQGYAHPSSLAASPDSTIQWNRLRAALYTFVKAAGAPDIPDKLCHVVVACTWSECVAICHQAALGPSAHSTIFQDDIVGEDGVPSGIFVHAIYSLLDVSHGSLPNCLSALAGCSESVLSSIVHACPDPTEFADPRCTLAESWFLGMTKVVHVLSRHSISDSIVDNMLVDSMCAVMQLLFNPSLGKTLEDRRPDPGMSLDGAQSLALCDFLTSFFHLGPKYLEALGHKVAGCVPTDCPPDIPRGLVTVASALFRGVQGSLPPWAVETIPRVYSAFYFAMCKNTSSFVRILGTAMRVRLSGTPRYGSVLEGHLLSGRYFAGVSDHFFQSFLSQVEEICNVDNTAGWKKLKQVIKAACGGKKKETDYKQKPAPTRWEFERF